MNTLEEMNIAIENDFKSTCRFQFNDGFTRSNIVSSVSFILNDCKSSGLIRDYNIICNLANNPSDNDISLFVIVDLNYNTERIFLKYSTSQEYSFKLLWNTYSNRKIIENENYNSKQLTKSLLTFD